MSEFQAPETYKIISTPEQADHDLEELFGLDGIPTHPRIDTLVVASSSPIKRQIVSDLLNPLGVSVKLPDSDGADEEAIKQILKELETPDHKYAARMSARKLIPYTEQISEGNPTIAFDTVVVHDRNVLEKPKSIDEARNMLRSVTNKNTNIISVYDGLTYAMRLNSGEAFYWRDSACISFLLKSLSDIEIDNYIEQVGENALNIAGAVDYSTDVGQSLLEDKGSGSPVYSMNRSRFGQIQDLTGSVSPRDPLRSRLLTRDTFPVIEPYFKGVPTHLVKGLILSGEPSQDS